MGRCIAPYLRKDINLNWLSQPDNSVSFRVIQGYGCTILFVCLGGFLFFHLRMYGSRSQMKNGKGFNIIGPINIV